MTVNEMIEALQVMANDGHGNLQVAFAYNYGDYWRTQAAPLLDDEPEVGYISMNDRLGIPAVIDGDKLHEIESEHEAEGCNTDFAADGTAHEMKFDGKLIQKVVLLG